MEQSYPRRRSGTSASTATVYARNVQNIRTWRVTELCLPFDTEHLNTCTVVWGSHEVMRYCSRKFCVRPLPEGAADGWCPTCRAEHRAERTALLAVGLCPRCVQRDRLPERAACGSCLVADATKARARRSANRAGRVRTQRIRGAPVTPHTRDPRTFEELAEIRVRILRQLKSTAAARAIDAAPVDAAAPDIVRTGRQAIRAVAR